MYGRRPRALMPVAQCGQSDDGCFVSLDMSLSSRDLCDHHRDADVGDDDGAINLGL